MNIAFKRVLPDDDKKIEAVYKIIKFSGEDMFKNKGLIHWKTPYPKESIKNDCANREVFIALVNDQYVHTFQLEFIKSSSNMVSISKFATTPQAAGKGIGKASIAYIEDYCRSKGIVKLCLEVYQKSTHAIAFYHKMGFSIVGSKPTKNFVVSIMEKFI